MSVFHFIRGFISDNKWNDSRNMPPTSRMSYGFFRRRKWQIFDLSLGNNPPHILLQNREGVLRLLRSKTVLREENRNCHLTSQKIKQDFFHVLKNIRSVPPNIFTSSGKVGYLWHQNRYSFLFIFGKKKKRHFISLFWNWQLDLHFQMLPVCSKFFLQKSRKNFPEHFQKIVPICVHGFWFKKS